MLTFAFMHHPYHVYILSGMSSLHLFTLLMFFLLPCFYTVLVLISVTARPKSKKSILSSVHVGNHNHRI